LAQQGWLGSAVAEKLQPDIVYPNPVDGSPAYCSWLGITCCTRPAVLGKYCNQSNVVVGLQLEANGLQGRIDDPAFMASIAQLHVCGLIRLSLFGNALSGSMVESWGDLSNLVYLDLGKLQGASCTGGVRARYKPGCCHLPVVGEVLVWRLFAAS